MSHYKTLIFDVGDVLFETKPDEQYRRLGEIARKNVEEIRTYVEANNLLSNYELGKIETSVFIDNVMSLLRINITASKFEEIWNSILARPNTQLINVIRPLINRYSLNLASNTNEIHWKHISNVFKTMDFELPAFLSFKVGCKKPDVNFFTEMFDTFDIDPRLTVFIDDNKKSIDKATSLGMLSHQHINNSDTINFLSSI